MRVEKKMVNTYVDNEIARLMLRMEDQMIDSEEYGKLLDRLGKLQKIRMEEKPDLPSSDAILSAGVNLLGIFMILHHEQLNVITTKAMSFIRLR